MDSDILFEQINSWGVITLNRPQALNALTPGMVTAMHAQLTQWAKDKAIQAVMIKGAGEKAFCAGGDIRWLHDAARDDVATARDFFRREYTNNAAVFHFPKPYIALIDAIVMGGGVGVSVHGDFRIAGDRTMFAMPETGIGLFPDVGGGYFLPRLDDGLGYYYGLTGARAKAADCVAAGIATHYVPTDKFVSLEQRLCDIDFAQADPFDLIDRIIDEFCVPVENAPIMEHTDLIRQCFVGKPDLDGVIASLAGAKSPFADELVEIIGRMSPTSLKLTFEQLRRGSSMTFNDTMKMEFGIVWRVMTGHDFFEGVRALIIDKDKAPKWQPAQLSAVGAPAINSYFEPLGPSGLVL